MPRAMLKVLRSKGIAIAGILAGLSVLGGVAYAQIGNAQLLLGGSGARQLLTPGKIYWADAGSASSATGRIRRANLDGSGVIEDIITTRFRPSDVDVDFAGGKIYWSENSGPHRSNLDGTGIELLKAVASHGIAIDVDGGKVYWTSPAQLKIQRSNLDSTNRP